MTDKEPTIADVLTILFIYYFFYPLIIACMINFILLGWWLYVSK